MADGRQHHQLHQYQPFHAGFSPHVGSWRGGWIQSRLECGGCPPIKLNPIITRVLFPAFAKIEDDSEKLRVNFYKLLSVVGIINFPALLGLMVVSNNVVPLVFGEKWNGIIPILQLLCIVGLLRSVGNPIGSLLMAKARVDISFKFNVFKTFLFIPAIFIGGHLAGAIGVTLGFLLVG